MFLDTLSAVILRLCDLYNWSLDDAATKCDIDPIQFWHITQRKWVPTINTLELLCAGFQVSPNDLLVAPAPVQELSFRIPMNVTQCLGRRVGSSYTVYPLCPQCGCSFEREFQSFCDRCGQRLCWRGYSRVEIVFLDKKGKR